LAGLPVSVAALEIAELPVGESAQDTAMAAALSANGAAVVFRFDKQAMQVRLMYHTEGGIQKTSRALAGSGEDGIADAVGLIAGGAVRFLIRQGTLENATWTVGAEETSDVPTPSTQKTTNEPTPRRSAVVSVIGQLSYVGQWAARNPDFTHGGRLSVALSLLDILRILIGVELCTPVVSEKDEAGFERFRVPFHLGASLMADVGRWRFGGAATAVFSSARHTPTSYSEHIVVYGQSYRFIPSMEALVQSEFRLSTHWGLYGAVGAEIFFEKTTYKITDGPTFFETYLRVQPKLIVGPVFYF
jgi:hypothetical protein